MKLCNFVIFLISHCTFAQNTGEIPPSSTGDETVTVLDLSKQNLKSLNDYDFSKYHALIEVDLSNNKLEHVKEDTFVDNLKLKKLNLSGNKKLTFPKFSTLLISDIEELNLTNCNIKVLPPNAFDGLTYLKTIDLSDNPLEENGIMMSTLLALRDPEKIILPPTIDESMIKNICKEIDVIVEIKIKGNIDSLRCEDVRKDTWKIANKEIGEPEVLIPEIQIPTKKETFTSDTTETDIESVKEKEQTTEATTNANQSPKQTDNTKELEQTTKTNAIANKSVQEETTEANTIANVLGTTLIQTAVLDNKNADPFLNQTPNSTEIPLENSDDKTDAKNLNKPESIVPNTTLNPNTSINLIPTHVQVPIIRSKVLEERKDQQTNTTIKESNDDGASAKHEHQETPTSNQQLVDTHTQKPDMENHSDHETQPLPSTPNKLPRISEESAASQKPETRLGQEEGKVGESTSGSSSAGTSILIFLVCGVVVAGVAAFGYKFYKSRNYRATRTAEPIERELKEIVVENNANKANSANFVTEEEPLMQKRENGVENADHPNSRPYADETPTNPKSTTHEIRSNSFGNGPYMPTTTTVKPGTENANDDKPKPR